MQSLLSSRGNLIPMALSLLFLVGILGFYLANEYAETKEALSLKDREEQLHRYFKNLYSALSENGRQDLAEGFSYGDFKEKFAFSDIETSEEETITFQFTDKDPEEDLAETLLNSSKIAVAKVDPENLNEIDRALEEKKRTGHFTEGQTFTARKVNKVPSPSFWRVLYRLLPEILLSLALLSGLLWVFRMILKAQHREKKDLEFRHHFISNVCHELKTPISTLSVALEALENFDAAEDPQRRKEFLRISRMESQRLSLLADRVLNLDLWDRKAGFYDLKTFSLKTKAEEILHLLQPRIEQCEAQVSIKSKGEYFEIHADEIHLGNVIHNLIENALKYSPKPAKIQLLLEEKSAHLLLSIRDEGIGIPAEFHQRIFDKFFRVPQQNSKLVEGYGLGLSYVKQVVQGHKGEIQVISSAGKGSTFRLHLPKAHISKPLPHA